MQAEPAGSPDGEDDEQSADEYGFEIPVMSPQVAIFELAYAGIA
jgi:hypothetical protein